MKSFFSKQLYWEGIKKIRVVGIAFAAITAILSGLIPFISMIDWYATEEQYRSSYTVTAMEFSIPALLLIMPAALIIILNMFSYLNKRSESDFYHAIPYKRSCVYISFMAACLSWLVFIAVLSIATAAFFFWIHPGLTVAVSIPFLNLGICILLAATIAATTAVAMTLTGTLVSNLLIGCLLFCFTPVVGFLFITALGEVIPLLYVPLTPARFLSPDFSLPLATLEVLMMGYNEAVLFNNAPMLIYTAIVTIVMLVAGCLIYMSRKSEMASKSAPNKLLQHIYRCAVSLPFALFAVMMIYMDEDFTLFIVLAVITLLVYFMYELITTKRFKNLLKAVPALSILLVGCLLFVGGTELTKAITLAYTPDADDLQTVGDISSSDMMYYGSLTYEEIMTQDIEIDNPEALKIVADALKDSVERTKNGTFYAHDDAYNYKEETQHTYRTIKITDKSGKVCGRELRMLLTDSNRLTRLFLESDNYADALITMPTDQQIQNIYYRYNLSDAYTEKLWDSFISEYNSLNQVQKLEYKSNMDISGGNVIMETYPDGEVVDIPQYTTLGSLEVQGTVGTKTFRSSYPLRTDFFPDTCALYATLFNESQIVHKSDYYSETYGPANLLEILPLIESDNMNSFSLDIGSVDSFYFDDTDSHNFLRGKKQEIRELVEFMTTHHSASSESTYYFTVSLNVHLDDYSIYHYNETIIALSEEDYQTLTEMVNNLYYKE